MLATPGSIDKLKKRRTRRTIWPSGLLWLLMPLILTYFLLNMCVLGQIVLMAPCDSKVYYFTIKTYIFSSPGFLTPHVFSYSIWCVAESCYFIWSTLICYLLFIYLVSATVLGGLFCLSSLAFISTASPENQEHPISVTSITCLPESKQTFIIHKWYTHT